MIKDLPILAVTPGEPAGIGPEVLLKLIAAHPGYRLLAVADIALLRQCADTLGSRVTIEPWQPGDEVSAGSLACLPVDLAEPAIPGRLSTKNAGYVLETLRQAVSLVTAGHDRSHRPRARSQQDYARPKGACAGPKAPDSGEGPPRD